MSSLLRVPLRVSPSRYLSPTFVLRNPQRLAYSDYGSDQSGHQQAKDSNPRRDLEHPGPPPPDTSGASSKSASSSSSSSSSQSPPDSTDKGAPTIQRPYSAAEDQDPEVRKHNEEMSQRHERSFNQLSEEDNKVDKQFWKGDVGDPKKKS